MLVTCASSTAFDLTRLATVKAELGLTDNAEDQLLSDLITRASDWANTYVGYPFQAQVYMETLAGFGGRHLRLSRTPIRQVMRLFDSTATCQATELLSSDFRVEDAEAGLLSRDKGFEWSQVERTSAGTFALGLTSHLPARMEKKPWLVEYEAGFVGPEGTLSTKGCSTSTGRTLPEMVEGAVVQKVKEWWLNRRTDPRIDSQRIGDLQIQYRSKGPGPGSAEAVLEPWRRFS
ncbi:MAG: phage head-tail connector protein [Candidatus Methylomirabilia bacterium]